MTHLTAPPVVGQWYSVPTVRYIYADQHRARDWPVLLPLHSDADRFPFVWEHYHVDIRFLAADLWSRMAYYNDQFGGAGDVDRDAMEYAQRMPVARLDWVGRPWVGVLVKHPPIVWRRRKCARSAIPYTMTEHPLIKRVQQDFAGTQCKAARAGWVCPHQGFPLGSVQEVGGVLTCPLHGLRVDAASGRVL